MSTGMIVWIGVIFAAYCIVGVVTSLAIGRKLGRLAEGYPLPTPRQSPEVVTLPPDFLTEADAERFAAKYREHMAAIRKM